MPKEKIKLKVEVTDTYIVDGKEWSKEEFGDYINKQIKDGKQIVILSERSRRYSSQDAPHD